MEREPSSVDDALVAKVARVEVPFARVKRIAVEFNSESLLLERKIDPSDDAATVANLILSPWHGQSRRPNEAQEARLERTFSCCSLSVKQKPPQQCSTRKRRRPIEPPAHCRQSHETPSNRNIKSFF